MVKVVRAYAECAPYKAPVDPPIQGVPIFLYAHFFVSLGRPLVLLFSDVIISFFDSEGVLGYHPELLEVG